MQLNHRWGLWVIATTPANFARWGICSIMLSMGLCCTAWSGDAAHYGIVGSLPLIDREPAPLNGYQVMVNYDPSTWVWRQLHGYLDGGFSRFWTNSTTNRALNIYSIAPVVRYAMPRQGIVSPFLEMSIGLSYLNRTRLQKRNLGIHFAFQDRIGIGALLGKAERFSLGVHAVHYSNAHLSQHNSGITIPLVLDIGYRFQ